MRTDPITSGANVAAPASIAQEGEAQDLQKLLDTAESKSKALGLAGNYQIDSVIGQGGMSVVYKAHHSILKDVMAVKMLHPHLCNNEKALLRFKQEAQAVRQLSHPNIVRVPDFGITEVDGEPYLIMEYVEGEPLDSLIEKTGGLPVDEAVAIFKQICSALSHAHAKRVLHRDLKPSNILVTRDSYGQPLVKIVDFGIAKVVSEENEPSKLTATGEIFGSPSYMSPEQCMGQQVTEQSDIYSLGCLMYEAVAGHPPFAGSNPMHVMFQQVNEPPPALDAVCRGKKLPSRLEYAIYKSMEKSVADRYLTADNLLEDLESVYREFGKLRQFANRSLRRLKTFNRRGLASMALCGALLCSIAYSVRNAVHHNEEQAQSRQHSKASIPMNADDELAAAIKAHPQLFKTMTLVAYSGKGLTNKGVNQFRECRHAQQLLLANLPIDDHGLQCLAYMPELAKLDLELDSWVTGSALSDLADPTYLQHLNLRATGINSKTVKILGSLVNLGELNLSDTALSASDLSDLPTSLGSLELCGLHFKSEGLQALKRLTGLQLLDLARTDVTDTDMSAVNQLSHLQVLGLQQTHITSKGLLLLPRLKGLQALFLDNTAVGDDGLSNLDQYANLERLSLAGTQTTDKGLRYIARCKNLRWLALDHCKVSLPGLMQLRNMKSLKQLFVAHLSEADKSALRASLKECSVR